MILHVIEAQVCGPHQLRLTFNDRVVKSVDLGPLIWGPIFEPLQNPACFARMELDKDFGVVHWPNGADLVPEALHALPGMAPGEHKPVDAVAATCRVGQAPPVPHPTKVRRGRARVGCDTSGA